MTYEENGFFERKKARTHLLDRLRGVYGSICGARQSFRCQACAEKPRYSGFGTDRDPGYPYVEYQKLPTRADGYTTISTADQVRFRYRIVVDERDTRCRIVGTIDAFSIGCRLPQAIRERYQLECVPIPEQSMRLYCITRRGGKQNAEIARYLQLLQEELEDEALEQAECCR